MHANFHHAMKLCDDVQKFVLHHTIAPTPINYSVIYLYLSKENIKLNQKLNLQLNTHKPLNNRFIEGLFNEFMSNNQRIEEDLFSPFEQTLANTLEHVDSQVNNEVAVIANLGRIEKALTKLGQYKPIQNIITFLLNAIGQSQNQHQNLSSELQKTSNEVNQLKAKLEESRQEALIDALTGLYNRRGCEHELQNLSISDTHSSIVVDIDHFKQVNDNFGHSIGDRVIKKVASIIKATVAEDDISVRYGGEEFVVIFAHKPAELVFSIAEKIRTNIESLKLVQRQTNTTLPPITVSIGIAEIAGDTEWSTLFNRADIALYQAKNSGRNRCKVAGQSKNPPIQLQAAVA
jgi:diguanylate cyclase